MNRNTIMRLTFFK